MAIIRLTVDIDADVKRESHGIAIKEGRPLREVVEQAMREYNARYFDGHGMDYDTSRIKTRRNIGFFAPLILKD